MKMRQKTLMMMLLTLLCGAARAQTDPGQQPAGSSQQLSHPRQLHRLPSGRTIRQPRPMRIRRFRAWTRQLWSPI